MSTRLKGWISSSLSQADALESGLNQIQDGMYLATAVGTQLDLLGRIYNVFRQGRLDDDYRKAIQAVAATAVNGTPDEIITFLRVAYGINGSYTPEYPGSFFIEPPSSLTMSQLQVMAPAGVAAFPADYAALENGEYEILENGEYILQVDKTGTMATEQDTLVTSEDTWQDTLSGPYDTLQDTLET